MIRSICLVATLVGGVVLARCGSGGSSGSSVPSTATAVRSTPAPVTTTEAPSQLKAALLTPADIGAGFVQASWDLPDTSERRLCGQESIDALYRNAIFIGVRLVRGGRETLTEYVRVYGDTGSALDVLGGIQAGLDCGQGKLGDGTPIQVDQGVNVTSEVGGEISALWIIHSPAGDEAVIATLSGKAVITFTFLGGSRSAGRPDPVTVAKVGVAKVLKG